MQIHQLFAIPVFQFEYPDTDDNETMRRTLLQMLDGTARPQTDEAANWNDTEVWRSAEDLHQHPDFLALFAFIETAVRSYMEAHEYAYSSASITSAWANIFQRGQSIDYHYHPNSFISGVYYVSARACPITFADIKQHWLVPPTREINALNSLSRVIVPDDGTLLLFPSYVYHRTNPMIATDPRISIAFNVQLTTGDSSSLWLK